jgi:alpha/beta superfamily hydrolase
MPLPREVDAPVSEDVFFPADGHCLHGELAYPEESIPSWSAVLAGPHPLLGGTMHNNVVAGVAGGLARRRFATLRFDYRGIGRSAGPRLDLEHHLAQFWKTSHVAEELQLAGDVAAAARFLQRAVGRDVPLVLIGYSFGCALLGRLAAPLAPAAVVLIAPTVTRHDYEPHLAYRGPVLVIASEDDFASDRERLEGWFDRLSPSRLLIHKRFDNHFFRGHEEWLAEAVYGFVQSHGR